MDKFNATHLTFGTGKMFSFFPSPLSRGLLLFVIWRQKGTRENTVISFPPPRRHSCSVSTKQDVYLKTPPKSCPPAQRGISYLFMYSLRAQREKKEDKQILKWHMHAFACTWAAFFGGMLWFFSCNQHLNVSMTVPQDFGINLRQKQKFQFVPLGCYLKPIF